MDIEIFLCRCCLNSTNDMIDLSSPMNEIQSTNNTILECLQSSTEIQTDDKDSVTMPQTICATCYDELKVTVEFRRKCSRSDDILRKQFTDQFIEDTLKDFDSFVEGGDNAPNDAAANCIDSSVKMESADDDDFFDENKLKSVATARYSFDEYNAVSSDDGTSVETQDDECFSDDDAAESTVASVSNKNTKRSPKKFDCHMCGRSYLNANHLKIHFLIHQENDGDKRRPNSPAEKVQDACAEVHSAADNTDSTNKCIICGKTYANSAKLKDHCRRMHTDELKTFLCATCGQSFRTSTRLRYHQNVHTGVKPFKCEFCGNEYAIRHSWRSHMIKHTQEKKYVCEYCDKSFWNKSALDIHRILHTGKNVKCPEPGCNKVFCRAAELVCHERSHSGEKPYKCELCPSRYTQKCHLTAHMYSHSDTKFVCSLCSKVYNQPGSLRFHMQTHERELPFKCDECGKSFLRKDRYRLHLQTHGIILPYGREENVVKEVEYLE